MSDYVKEQGLCQQIPDIHNGCYLVRVSKRIKKALSELLPTAMGESYKHYIVLVFEKEAIKLMFKKLGVKAPSDYYRKPVKTWKNKTILNYEIK